MNEEHAKVEQREELAGLLAVALLRLLKMKQLQINQNSATPSLEVPTETVLSVTSGLLPETPKREGER